MRFAVIAATVLAIIGGTARSTAAQTVNVQVDVRAARDIAREIRQVIDLAIVRDIGREISSAMRGALADVPWRDLPGLDLAWRDLPWRDLPWRDLAAAVGWQNRDFRSEQTDRETRTLALGPSGSLELRNINGPISVVAGSGREVTIEIVRISRGRTDADAKAGLAQVTAEVEHRGERATINARYPQSRGRQNFSVSVGYNVTAPPGTHVTVGGFSTNTTLKGIKGDISVELVAGDISISGATRISAARTFSGSIWIADVEGDGNVSTGTISGPVTIERVKARQVSVDSMSGGITARDVTVENATLKTMNGAIEFSGTVSRTGRYELQSHNGPIRLVLAGAGFDLTARTFAGAITPAANIELRNLNVTRTSLRGTAGTGGATIVATTFSGGISISRK